MKKNHALTIISFLLYSCIYGQVNPLPLNIQQAYKNQTRSSDGTPGPRYWQNHARYTMDAVVDTETDILKGTATIHYSNNSPDTLSTLVLRLYQDFFRKGNARQWPIPEGDLTQGTQISRLVINGTEYSPEDDFPRWLMTNFMLRLKEKILPGSTTTIELDWQFNIPTVRGLRMAKYDDGHYFIAYWYPQVAVYDDVDGWDRIDYTGMVEFYNDFNDFRVKLTVPDKYAIWATGELQEAEKHFQKGILDKLEQAKTADGITRIIAAEDYENKTVFTETGTQAWEFQASAVPDFSFVMSTHSNWDGTSLEVDGSSGRRVLVNAVYPEGSDHWSKGAEVSRASIEYMSTVLPGVPFPYPHMTSVWSGGRGGGMESPMMANDGAPRSYTDFVELLFHEIAHTYFPFYMGTNERKYAWMDEGWASYLPNELVKKLSPDSDYLKETVDGYSSLAGQEIELPLMVPSFQHNNFTSARVSAYTRPAMAYHFLRDALGDPLFKKALKEFMSRWNGKHPLPYDFFNTFNEVVGENLNWYWQPWFFEAGYPDLGIKSVSDKNEVVIEKLGTHPIPISLYYITADNQSEKIYQSTAIWKDGKKAFTIQLPPDIELKSLELGNDHIPDMVPENNSWKR